MKFQDMLKTKDHTQWRIQGRG